MVMNMLRAISLLPRTVRAVAEIGLGVALVGDAADGAAMERCVVAPGTLPGQSPLAALGEPGQVPGEKDKKVAGRGKDQQAGMPAAEQQLKTVAEPGEQRQPFNPDRQDEKDVDGEIGVEKGKGKEDRTADEDVADRGRRNEKGYGDRQQVPDQEEYNVAELPPLRFEGRPHQVEEIPGEKREERAHVRRVEDKGGEPPPFPLHEEAGGEPGHAPVDSAGHEHDVE